MTDAVLFAAKYELTNMVIVGGKEAHLVADLLVKHNTPIILDRIHRLPNTPDTDVDMPYKQAGLLHAAGVSIGFLLPGRYGGYGTKKFTFFSRYCCSLRPTLRRSNCGSNSKHSKNARD